MGIAEGWSFILLLGIAMPLKYKFDMPMAVSIVGGIHGLLFVLYSWMAFNAVLNGMSKFMGLKCIAAAIVPFGPFIIDKQLKALDTDYSKESTD